VIVPKISSTLPTGVLLARKIGALKSGTWCDVESRERKREKGREKKREGGT
jgi:hypothetical protein